MICKSIVVFGSVQGVGFRNWTLQKALELGLSGIVKNRMDGTVYIEIKGEEMIVDKLIAACQSGPVLSRVDRLEIKEIPIVGSTTFKIVR